MDPAKSQEISVPESMGTESTREIYYPDLKSTIKIFFVYILYTIVISIPATVCLIALSSTFIRWPILKSVLFLLQNIVTHLTVIIYTIRKSKKQNGHFSKISFIGTPVWLVPILIIGALALVIPLEHTSSWIPMPKWAQKVFEESFTKEIFSIINVVIAAPILEEILCRGIILRGLLKNYTPYTAILISATLFGALHLNPWQAIPAFLAGLFIGWVYYKTQSVIPGIIIHTTINSIAMLFLFLPANRRDLLGLFGTHYYVVAVFFSITIFVAVCIIINRKFLNVAGPLFKTENTYSFSNNESSN
ncbi:CPBP family intramembrane glutamic endopeptidase [Mucilaginibacter gotjawali]|uniref:CAAX prenyl protease 2/Lysostaphin resistance protein A-like domain-containing protein n=1 Tax=Mucilaginibacter gotjawali TaxID=1550579 RepID=A0A839SH08_9SPHI|nr:type II CAAX endopeptidase family protein [Mucilaginibacter gotjawali]MBB3056180.1 hypothetical protein [Mucilaginibacter gotjawali]